MDGRRVGEGKPKICGRGENVKILNTVTGTGAGGKKHGESVCSVSTRAH